MVDPLFWLGLSILLVAVSLTAVLVAALPALQELSRAARSAEKLFDTLNRELPPTLEAIRLTGMEMSELTDDMSEGVQSAGQLIKQIEQGLNSTRQQAQKAQKTTRSFLAGAKAAWKTFMRKPSTKRRSRERQLPASSRLAIDLEDRQTHPHSTKGTPKGWEESPQKNLSDSLRQPTERIHPYRKNEPTPEYRGAAVNPLDSTFPAEEVEVDGGAPSAPEASETTL